MCVCLLVQRMHLVQVEDGGDGVNLAAKLLEDVQRLAGDLLLDHAARAQVLEAAQQLQGCLGAAQLPGKNSNLSSGSAWCGMHCTAQCRVASPQHSNTTPHSKLNALCVP